MGSNIGPKIGVDGSKEFKSQLAQITQSMKVLKSEAKLVSSEFIGQSDSVEALSKKNDVLKRTVYTLNEQLELQKKELKMAAKEYGEANEYTMKLQESVNKTQTAINKANAEIRDNTEAMRNFGNATEEANEKMSLSGDIFKGSFKADAIMEALRVVASGIRDAFDYVKESIQDAAEYADDVLTKSAISGLSTDMVQAFMYMEDFIDVDFDTVSKSLAKLTKNMSSARNGSGAAAKAFKKLGISFTNEVTGELRDNKDVFFEIVDALGKVTNETERDAIAMDIFGKSAQELNPMILAGKDALSEYYDEASKLGYALSDEDLEKLNTFKDETQKLKSVFDGFTMDIFIDNIDPLIEGVKNATDYVSDLRDTLGEDGLAGVLEKVAQDLKDTIDPLWAVKLEMEVMLTPLKNLWKGVKNLGDAFVDMWNKATPPGGIGGQTAEGVKNAIKSASAGVKNGTSSAKKSAASNKTGGATFNINPRTMSKSDTDYVINKANSMWGGNL